MAILFIGGPGPVEIALILAIFVLLFGASKLPELGRSTGQAMGEFTKGRQEVERDLQAAKSRPKPDETEPATEA